MKISAAAENWRVWGWAAGAGAIDAYTFMELFYGKWKEVGVVGFSPEGDSKSFEETVPRKPFWFEGPQRLGCMHRELLIRWAA